MLAAQSRYLNLMVRAQPKQGDGVQDGAVKMQFFDALLTHSKSYSSDPQGLASGFYNNAASIAREQVKAARAAGPDP